MPKIRQKVRTRQWIAIGAASLIVIMGAINAGNQAIQENQAAISGLLGETEAAGLKENVYYGSNPTERIAIIRVAGTIGESALSGDGYDQQALLSMISQASADPTVKGILLAVDSPGGGVYESAELRDYLQLIKENTGKMIYTSFGSMAASGGYYISAETDKIFAAKETVTGSIGVIMSSYNFSGLMENLGVESQVIKSGAMKDIMSTTRKMTNDEKEVLQAYIDDSFERFLEIVMNGRNMTREEALAIADGRIFSGAQAVENGLVDEIGYEEDAIIALAKDLGIDDPIVFEYEKPATYSWQNFLPFGFELNGKKALTEQVETLWQAIQEQETPRAQYLYRGGH